LGGDRVIVEKNLTYGLANVKMAISSNLIPFLT
jgi:hypothetical protein